MTGQRANCSATAICKSTVAGLWNRGVVNLARPSGSFARRQAATYARPCRQVKPRGSIWPLGCLSIRRAHRPFYHCKLLMRLATCLTPDARGVKETKGVVESGRLFRLTVSRACRLRRVDCFSSLCECQLAERNAG